VGFNVTTGQMFYIRNIPETIRHQLFVDFKKAYDLGSIVQYSEFGVPMKLVRLIKMCLNETCSKVYICKHLSDKLATQDGLKRGYAL
jgi:hypothetical protein